MCGVCRGAEEAEGGERCEDEDEEEAGVAGWGGGAVLGVEAEGVWEDEWGTEEGAETPAGAAAAAEVGTREGFAEGAGTWVSREAGGFVRGVCGVELDGVEGTCCWSLELPASCAAMGALTLTSGTTAGLEFGVEAGFEFVFVRVA